MNQVTPEKNEQQRALDAAIANEKQVTAWVTLDVEAMRPLSALEQTEVVRGAALMIRDSVIRELAAHGLIVKAPRLRRR